MSVDMDALEKRYSSLDEGELIYIALNGDIIEEAKSVLCRELVKRNIDLEAEKARVSSEESLRDLRNEESKIERRKEEISTSKFASYLALIIMLIGVVWAFKQPEQALEILAGCVLMVGFLFTKLIFMFLKGRLISFLTEK